MEESIKLFDNLFKDIPTPPYNKILEECANYMKSHHSCIHYKDSYVKFEFDIDSEDYQKNISIDLFDIDSFKFNTDYYYNPSGKIIINNILDKLILKKTKSLKCKNDFKI